MHPSVGRCRYLSSVRHPALCPPLLGLYVAAIDIPDTATACPRSSIAPKIQSKIPAGQINHAHTRVWSTRIFVAHVHTRDRLERLSIIGN